MTADLDYYVWEQTNHDAAPPRRQWAWEVVSVDDDGEETSLAAGFKPTQAEAAKAAKDYIRSH